MSFAHAIATVGGLTMLSRVAGFARDILTAAILGAGPVADAFFVALKLPNFFRRLFAEGAFTVSFVPMFSAELQRNGRRAAQGFAEEALAVMVTVLLPFVIAMVAAMPWLMHALAPGFSDEPEKFALAVDFARMTFPYLLLVSLVVSAALAAVATWVGGLMPELTKLLAVVNFAVSFLMVTLLFGAIYKILPEKVKCWEFLG